MMNNPFPQLSPEEKLLISLCRLEFSGEQRSLIRGQITGVKDWGNFVRLANGHGIIALVWYNISETGNAHLVPSEFLNKLHEGYLKSLTRNAFIFSVLDEVESLAGSENIKIVLLKGLALEKTFYGDKGLRQMSDLDILVRKEDALKLRKILLKNGFDAVPMISPLHDIMSPYWNHLPAMNKKGVFIEIHFRLFGKANNLPDNIFIEKSKPGSRRNVVHFPDPQLHFFYLVKHLARHEDEGFSQLRMYADLAIMLDAEKNMIPDDRLLEYSQVVNIHEDLMQKLKILEIFWGIEMCEFLKLPQDKIITETVIEKFLQFLRQPGNSEVEKNQENYLNDLRNVPGISEKILFVAGHIFPSLMYMKYRYNTKTKIGAIFYYPVRWVRVAGRLIKKGGRRKAEGGRRKAEG